MLRLQPSFFRALQAEYEEKETREGQFEIACRELHLRREATAADSVSFEDFGKQVAAVFSQLQEYFHRFCQKVQDTPICGGCVEKARILDFEIVFEGMGPFQKMSSECNHFSRSKKCIGLCRLHYLQEHWEPSENIKWFEEHIWCGKKRPNKKFRLLYEWVEDEIDARKSILVSEVREHAGLLLGEFGKYKKFERLGKRMRTFLNLDVVRMGGRKVKWVAKK